VLELTGAPEIALELERTGCEPEGVGIMARKGRTVLLRLDHVPLKAAPLLKQEMLAAGGDSAHARGIADHSRPESSAVLMATPGQYRRALDKLDRQPFQLREIALAVEAALAHHAGSRPRTLPGTRRPIPVGGKTRVMGVINITPDSFSDGGKYAEPGRALARARGLVSEGAELIDVGAESTRPGAVEVDLETEWGRLAPVLAELGAGSPVPISIDTRHAEIAERAIAAGADLVNDVSGLRDAAMRRLLARTGTPAIAMHMRGTPTTMQQDTSYTDLRGEVYGALADAVALAVEEGVPADRLLIDPGLGFGKSAEQNLELLAHLGEFRSLGPPVVVGASRKGFLGRALGGAAPAERLEAGIAAAVLAATAGAAYVRTHDVGPTVRALKLADAALGRVPLPDPA
jgi:dihydropteroate synthase